MRGSHSSCPSFAATEWLRKRPAASTWLLGPPAVEVRFAGSERGLGVFAVRSVRQFSQILSDAPLILMKPGEDLPELYQQFHGLSPVDRQAYLALSFHENASRDALLKDKLLRRGFGQDALSEMAEVASIMQTNAFNVDVRDGQGACHRALFPNVARVNHSCAPNAHVCFYPPGKSGVRGRMVLHALRTIRPGEEIFISYFNILLTRAERQTKAQKWGFRCCCPVCSCDPPVCDREESLRETARQFTSEQRQRMSSANHALREIRDKKGEALALASEILTRPELLPALPDLYDGLAELEAKIMDVKRRELRQNDVILMLEQSAIWEASITGSDSPSTRRRLDKLSRIAGFNNVPCIAVDSEGSPHVEWMDAEAWGQERR